MKMEDVGKKATDVALPMDTDIDPTEAVTPVIAAMTPSQSVVEMQMYGAHPAAETHTSDDVPNKNNEPTEVNSNNRKHGGRKKAADANLGLPNKLDDNPGESDMKIDIPNRNKESVETSLKATRRGRAKKTVDERLEQYNNIEMLRKEPPTSVKENSGESERISDISDETNESANSKKTTKKGKGKKSASNKIKESMVPAEALPPDAFPLDCKVYTIAEKYNFTPYFSTIIGHQLDPTLDGNTMLKYRVHYLGFADKFDETVPKDYVFEAKQIDGKTNSKYAKDYKYDQQAVDKLLKSLGQGKNDDDGSVKKPNNRKRKNRDDENKTGGKAAIRQKNNSADVSANGDDLASIAVTLKDPESKTDAKADAGLCITIPTTLKRSLIEDFTRITREHFLLELPAKLSVAQICADYIASIALEDQELTIEVCEALVRFFDRALSILLLYRFEKPQYLEHMLEGQTTATLDKPASTIYGCVHLLRLFTKLPRLLSSLHLSEEKMKLFVSSIQNFVTYIELNFEKLTSTSYFPANSEYLKLVDPNDD